ncbi:MAG: phosphatase PAP2 family protein [Acidobacteriota bacterium]|nr:phosphatase PAP2 family protein [Acidobacteriota bacterium]
MTAQILDSTGRTRLFASLDALEVNVVIRAVASAQRLHLCGVARAATRLGNGWIYPLVSLLLLLFGESERSFRILGTSAASLALAFSVYPSAKRFLARTRPCDYAAFLQLRVRGLVLTPQPLDRYSCPSGHAMTAAAYAVPLVVAWPAAGSIAVVMWAVIGWSRVAVGHHYVSDVLLGSILGAGIAAPVVVLAL